MTRKTLFHCLNLDFLDFGFSFLILMDATANSILKMPNQSECMTITDGRNVYGSKTS